MKKLRERGTIFIEQGRTQIRFVGGHLINVIAEVAGHEINDSRGVPSFKGARDMERVCTAYERIHAMRRGPFATPSAINASDDEAGPLLAERNRANYITKVDIEVRDLKPDSRDLRCAVTRDNG